jgi:hypothetical protein
MRFWESVWSVIKLNVWTLRDFLIENELRLDESVEAKINEHLRGLGTSFRE